MAKPKIAKNRIELIIPSPGGVVPDWEARDMEYPDHRAVPLEFCTVVRSGNTEPPHYCLAFEAKTKGSLPVTLEPGDDVRMFMSEAQALELWGHLDSILPDVGKRRVKKTFPGSQ